MIMTLLCTIVIAREISCCKRQRERERETEGQRGREAERQIDGVTDTKIQRYTDTNKLHECIHTYIHIYVLNQDFRVQV